MLGKESIRVMRVCQKQSREKEANEPSNEGSMWCFYSAIHSFLLPNACYELGAGTGVIGHTGSITQPSQDLHSSGKTDHKSVKSGE